MTNESHSIRLQTLNIQCGPNGARALRERLSDFNLTQLIPVIDRVLTEATTDADHTTIDRLEVHLGTIPLDEFDTLAPARLYSELRDALERALLSPVKARRAGGATSRADLLEWYLMRGTLPFRAAAGTFSFNELFNQVERDDPTQLAARIRRIGKSRHALERLVRQLSGQNLLRLLELLEPAHAALILAYMFDLREIHREETLGVRDAAQFDRLLWLLVFSYLIREAGSQFNRRMFVASLVHGFALQYSVSFEALLHLLAQGLERLGIRQTPQSSLPAVLRELLEAENEVTNTTESGPQSGGEATTKARLRPAELASLAARDPRVLVQLLRSPALKATPAELNALTTVEPEAVVRIIRSFTATDSQTPMADAETVLDVSADGEIWSEFIARLTSTNGSPAGSATAIRESPPTPAEISKLSSVNSESLAELIRRYGANRDWLERTIGALDRPTVFRLIEILEPEHAARVVEFLGDLSEVHRNEPILPREPAHFDRLLYVLTITYLVEEPGSHFNRKSFCLSLIEQLAQREAVAPTVILAALAKGIEAARARSPLRSSLPAILAELSAELAPRPVRVNILADLPTQSIPMIEMALAHSDPAEQQRTILAALGQMQSADIEALLARLLPAIQDANAPVSQALQAARTAAANPLHFYARLIATLLAAKPLDFAAIAETTSQAGARPAIAGAPALWPLVALTGAIAAAITATPASGNLWELVDTLILRHPQPAAAFLRLTPIRLKLSRRSSRWGAAELTTAILSTPSPGNLKKLTSRLRQVSPQYAEHLLTPTSALDAAQLLNRLLSARSGDERDGLLLTFELFLRGGTSDQRAEILNWLRSPAAREQLLRILPQQALIDLIGFLLPGQVESTRRTAAVLASAWSRTNPKDTPQIWSIALNLIASRAYTDKRLITEAAMRSGTETFQVTARQLAEQAGYATLRDTIVAAPQPSTTSRPPMPRKPVTEPDPPHNSDPIYIANGGLVITAPFLPHLFHSLNMLEPDDQGRQRWLNPDVGSRAVHLLQYLADANTSAPEPTLVLNKLLCGLEPSTPIAPGIELTERETELCDQLLGAILANWTALANTSVAGLRETFLQREARLNYADNRWHCRVNRRTLDVLVDSIPWSFAVILNNWMPTPIHVTW